MDPGRGLDPPSPKGSPTRVLDPGERKNPGGPPLGEDAEFWAMVAHTQAEEEWHGCGWEYPPCDDSSEEGDYGWPEPPAGIEVEWGTERSEVAICSQEQHHHEECKKEKDQVKPPPLVEGGGVDN